MKKRLNYSLKKTDLMRDSHFEIQIGLQFKGENIWSDALIEPLNNISKSQNFKTLKLDHIEKLPIKNLDEIISSKIYCDFPTEPFFSTIMPPWVIALTVIVFVFAIVYCCCIKLNFRKFVFIPFTRRKTAKPEVINDSCDGREQAQTLDSLLRAPSQS